MRSSPAYFAFIILAALIVWVLFGCSTAEESRIPNCEWDASCDYEPPEYIEIDGKLWDNNGVQVEVEHPKKKQKKK